MESKVEYDFSKLNDFIKAVSDKSIVKVGILGSKTNRNDKDGKTNAEIGAMHEFGSELNNILRRSFLRMPMHNRAEQIVNEAGKDAMELFVKGNPKQVLNNLGVACLGAIHDAFKTRGFGTWQALKRATIRQKIQHNPDPLINTRQLERSITFKVEEK